jgi:hypothetical protein
VSLSVFVVARGSRPVGGGLGTIFRQFGGLVWAGEVARAGERRRAPTGGGAAATAAAADRERRRPPEEKKKNPSRLNKTKIPHLFPRPKNKPKKSTPTTVPTVPYNILSFYTTKMMTTMTLPKIATAVAPVANDSALLLVEQQQQQQHNNNNDNSSPNNAIHMTKAARHAARKAAHKASAKLAKQVVVVVDETPGHMSGNRANGALVAAARKARLSPPSSVPPSCPATPLANTGGALASMASSAAATPKKGSRAAGPAFSAEETALVGPELFKAAVAAQKAESARKGLKNARKNAAMQAKQANGKGNKSSSSRRVSAHNGSSSRRVSVSKGNSRPVSASNNKARPAAVTAPAPAPAAPAAAAGLSVAVMAASPLVLPAAARAAVAAPGLARTVAGGAISLAEAACAASAAMGPAAHRRAAVVAVVPPRPAPGAGRVRRLGHGRQRGRRRRPGRPRGGQGAAWPPVAAPPPGGRRRVRAARAALGSLSRSLVLARSLSLLECPIPPALST